ncbi:MAG TPA: NlpC/P60 family protein [Gemmatimonadaceae bacterium]|nr:NlpC/P60 family protein [Gemmatimonadaceae bacterium]
MLVFTAVALAIAIIAVSTPSPTFGADANSRSSQAARIVHFAKTHLGARFRIGSEGPRVFDCSGLVYRVYQQAGLVGKIGGKRMLAASYYRWFKQRGLVSRSNPQVGDVIWWTHKGRISHTGLYIGGGKAISALINPWGVKVHHLGTIHAKFLGFGHVRLGD